MNHPDKGTGVSIQFVLTLPATKAASSNAANHISGLKKLPNLFM
jgi:hypothetical protein